ncbi:hypothetical protein Goklo_017557 [Gossypium klotzschianum]|uniref:Uncharacterized protein n=1 Tax=Gossypium klotzschianum TaxID=34286 RepID=A0A7J8UHU9_9ROSI|nr:hypothetical protein [Gossypium klotzschianum]
MGPYSPRPLNLLIMLRFFECNSG